MLGPPNVIGHLQGFTIEGDQKIKTSVYQYFFLTNLWNHQTIQHLNDLIPSNGVMYQSQCMSGKVFNI
jgi:hypothetical protein